MNTFERGWTGAGGAIAMMIGGIAIDSHRYGFAVACILVAIACAVAIVSTWGKVR